MAEYKLSIKQTGGGNYKSRIGYLDALKCLAIILVVVGHIDGMKIGVGEYETLWGCIRYTFQMPLFFFISGIFACSGIKKHWPLHVLIWQKIKTLLWPAFLFEFLMSLVLWVCPSLPSTGLGYYWFTFTLFECFLIYYVVAYLLKTRPLWRDLLLLIVSIAFVGMLAFKIVPTSLDFVDMNHLSKYFQYFFIGTLFSTFKEKGDRLLRSQVAYTICLIAFTILMFLTYKGLLPSLANSLCRDILLRYVALYIVFALFYNVQEFFEKDSKMLKLISYIGQHSLEIYLLHFFFLPSLNWLKAFRVDEMFVIELPISLILSIIVICVALCTNYILTRSKYISYLLYGK